MRIIRTFMLEREGGFSPNDYARVTLWRELFSDSRPLRRRQIDQVLRVANETERAFFEELTQSPVDTRSLLSRKRDAMTKRDGRAPSRPRLTTQTITDDVHIPINQRILSAYQDATISREEFIGWYDYADGILAVTEDIVQAEEAIEGVTDKSVIETIVYIEDNRGTPLSLDESSRVYLHQAGKSKRISQLLVADPTGKTVVENAVGEIRQDAARRAQNRKFNRLYPFQESKLVLAGAEFAQRAYNVIYPFTEKPRA